MTEPDRLPDRPMVDGLLEFLCSLAETGVELGITLTLGGSVISGQMVGRQRYAGELAERLSGAGEVGVSLGQAIVELLTPPHLPTSEEPDVNGDAADVPADFNFIHLIHATTYHGAQQLGSGEPWRGRLQSVSGWTLGQLGLSGR